MANVKTHDNMQFIYSRTRGALSMLIAQFLLGMGVNLIGTPGSNLSKVTQGIILGLHVILALGLVVVSIFIVQAAVQLREEWPKLARVGASGVGLAFIGGLGTQATSGTAANWLSYVMSIGFILAFAGYGYLFAKLTAARSGH